MHFIHKLTVRVFLMMTVCLLNHSIYAADNNPMGNGLKLFNNTSANSAFKPQLQIIENSKNNFTFEVHLKDAVVVDLSTHNQNFSLITLPESGFIKRMGAPKLPVIRKYIQIPEGADFDYSLEINSQTSYSLSAMNAHYPIMPVQLSLRKLPNAKTPFKKDQRIYGRDAFFPQSNLKVTGPLFIRGHQLMMIEYAPIQYNPVQNELNTTLKATLRFTFKDKKAASVVKENFSPHFNDWFVGSVINYKNKKKAQRYTPKKYAEGILYIIGDRYASDAGLKAYIEKRGREGHFVKTVKMNNIGQSDVQLRSFIQDQYKQFKEAPLSFVVLVGDVDDVPSHPSTLCEEKYFTDSFYAAIDPPDYDADLLAPDVIVSRISVNDSNELRLYLQKAEKYLSKDFASDTDWLKKISFIASCDNSNITEGSHDKIIEKYTAPLGYTGTYPNTPQIGGDTLYCSSGEITEAVLQTALSNGRGIINFSGHGSPTSWSDPYLGESTLSQIQPAVALPFVISNACLTGTFSHTSDCWGEQWLSHKNGAIAFWGASSSSYWEEDDVLEESMWRGIFDKKMKWFGDIARNAKLDLLAHYGDNESIRYYFEIYNMLGDATLTLIHDTAFEMTPQYSDTLTIGSQAFDVRVMNGNKPVKGALVAVRGVKSGLSQVGYTDQAGIASILFDPVPTTVEDVEVFITAQNAVPYSSILKCVTPTGPYLLLEKGALTSNGTETVYALPGTRIIMPITLKNIGSLPAKGIKATVTNDTKWISFIRDQPIFDDMDVQESKSSNSHISFEILDEALEKTPVTMYLNWSTESGKIRHSKFYFTIERPRLSYVSHAVDDENGFCDKDGIADADEPSVYAIIVRNDGNIAATDVALNLSMPDTYLQVLQRVDRIEVNSSVTVPFTVIPEDLPECPAINVPFTLSVRSNGLERSDRLSFETLLNADIFHEVNSYDMESPEMTGWTHFAAAGVDDWECVNTSSHSASQSWFSENVAAEKDAYLVMSPLMVLDEGATLKFWQKYDLEEEFDGAIIEISVDGGKSFSDLEESIIKNGYPLTIDEEYGSLIAGRKAWTGEMDWHEVIIDLSEFKDTEVVVRFRLVCDTLEKALGWWIDDVAFKTSTYICQEKKCD